MDRVSLAFRSLILPSPRHLSSSQQRSEHASPYCDIRSWFSPGVTLRHRVPARDNANEVPVFSPLRLLCIHVPSSERSCGRTMLCMTGGIQISRILQRIWPVAMVKGLNCSSRTSWKSLCTRIRANPKQRITRSFLVIEICAFSSLLFIPSERNRICWIPTLYLKHTWTSLTIGRYFSFSELTQYYLISVSKCVLYLGFDACLSYCACVFGLSCLVVLSFFLHLQYFCLMLCLLSASPWNSTP